MSELNIKKILSEHAKWLRGDGGNRAVLPGADLSHLDLSNACLSNADLLSASLNSAKLNSVSLSYTNLRFSDLRFADLRGADLSFADLRSAVLPKTDAILASPWGWCHVQREYIRIGCQYRKTSSWRLLSNRSIDKMDYGTLIWWKQHKGVVMAMAEACELHKEAGE